jgi:hypothetical protein
LLLHAIVHPADIQDRDGGVLVLSTLFGMFPFLKKLFADGGKAGLSNGSSQGLRASRSKSSSALITHKRLRVSPSAVGCRTHLCLAEPMPAIGQGF